jgi:histidinol dehydrogenase
MRKISYKQKNFETVMDELYRRPSFPPEIEAPVREILSDVKKDGNKALKKYAEKFDGVKFKKTADFTVTEKELDEASTKIHPADAKAIKAALTHISLFASKKIPQPWTFSPRPGVILGERFKPLERIGVYIPGGTAPLVSTAIHTAGIAAAAGVKEIVAVTPANSEGKIHSAILYALKEAGATEIYKLGGVYGIGALAYGTKSIRKVEKIVGPGNAYVTAAKKLVYGETAIDMVAGPSEIMIISDSKSNPAYIAADMLSQAEHGSGFEQAVLLSTSKKLIKSVADELQKQAEKLSRKNTIRKVMEKGIFMVYVKDMGQAAEIAGNYAPEHLEIICERAGNVAKNVKAAGAVFIGPWTPEPLGDFMAGPSHVLPTGGSAKFFNGLTVESFFRRMSIINYQKNALEKELPHIRRFARMEGLDGHENSAAIRITGKNKREK